MMQASSYHITRIWVPAKGLPFSLQRREVADTSSTPSAIFSHLMVSLCVGHDYARSYATGLLQYVSRTSFHMMTIGVSHYYALVILRYPK
ncbi:hypothetical protein CY34DRAFT_144152 [Suillus luteus UH-Slu-Lm8-n1]|uniref:Uncharacterized protein n=1 Tax=Suillus luteus UH-Slu-Lm8-n1 TaxID=930992 RepID=A0A0D0BGV9_9AGAM|nr:hypothetical protein CY34DRAFT_144152 [Suillus luteus UH-Slu-Lm8-n1]